MENRMDRRQRSRVAATATGAQSDFCGAPAVTLSCGKASTKGRGPQRSFKNDGLRNSNEGTDPPDSELNGRSSLDPLRLYLSEIHTLKRLSRDEEIKVAQQIDAARREIDQEILKAPSVLNCVLRVADRLRPASVDSETPPEQDDFDRMADRAVDPDEPLGEASVGCTTTIPKLGEELANLIFVLEGGGCRPATLSGRARRLIIDELRMSLTSSCQASIAKGNCGAGRTGDPRRLSLVSADANISRPNSLVPSATAPDIAAGEQLLANGASGPADNHSLAQSLQVIRAAESQIAHFTKRLVEANLSLVVGLVKRYQSSGPGMMDLIQEGNLGLMRAAEKFDHRYGAKFSTYATWWIKHAIVGASIEQGRTIRIPPHILMENNRLVRTRALLTQRIGREATPEELAAHTGLSLEQIRKSLTAVHTVSLDAPLSSNEDASIADLVVDHEMPSPLDAAIDADLRGEVRNLFNGLSQRERQILGARYGIVSDADPLAQRLGKQPSIGHERIRQIRTRALRKLRVQAVELLESAFKR